MNKNLIIGLLVTVVIAIGGYALSRDNVGAPSGPAHWQMESFLEGVSAGQRDQFSVSRTGVITTALSVTEATGTSTVNVISGSASSGGRIILEDTDAGGCSEISILNGTVISATVTCP